MVCPTKGLCEWLSTVKFPALQLSQDRRPARAEWLYGVCPERADMLLHPAVIGHEPLQFAYNMH